MKKLAKRLGIVVLVLGVLYLVYLLFIMPNGFTDREDLATSFIENLADDNACEDYFNSETISICETFQTSLEGHTVEVTNTSMVQGVMDVTLLVDDAEVHFDFYFESYAPSGLRGVLTDEYYLIDSIR
jgi:hypothetical protein